MKKITLAVLMLAASVGTGFSQVHPTVLITGSAETDTTVNATGAGVQVGNAVVGGAGGTKSTYEHSELWEVARRFQEECPKATFVTNSATPHTLTIQTDYQKLSGLVFGGENLFQLVLLDAAGNPVYISKKNWLRREIKPVCKAISQQK
ncbi:MAG: hypothetical protein JOZ83_04330 [Silvibacterium sp.]|nr:hypothetical protein [Silvibacterium sp.]